MRKQLLIIVTLFCFVILLVGAQSGFAKPKKTVVNAAEELCFDQLDNDGDNLIDCADPDCNSAPCDTVLPGICKAGTVTCVDGAAQCVPNNQPVPEVCDDGLDNDCDGFIDIDDPDCGQTLIEDCFNGIDDDGDTFIDCADIDCEGAQNESCQTALLGICAEGMLTCVAGESQCVPNNQPDDEVCGDGLDNDCDGSVDANDLDCAIEGNKVTICHIPRGNPARARTIKVGLASLSAHEAHGDTIGPCPENSSKRPKKTGRPFKRF